MLSEKEKFEEEIKLLEESLELDVITKDEFENAKKRIEEKLKELNQKEESDSKPEEEVKEESIVMYKDIKKEEEEKHDEKKEEEKPEIKEEELKKDVTEEIKGETVKEEVKQEVPEEETQEKLEVMEEEKIEEKVETKKEVEKEKAEEEVREQEKPTEAIKVEEEEKAKEEEKVTEEKPEVIREEEKAKEEVFEEEIKINKKTFVYVAIILILVVGSWYFFFSKPDVSDISVQDFSTNIPIEPVNLMIACSSDDECIKEGSIGICNNPGKENAECTYIEDVKAKLMVLNSNDCFNCQTARILSILKSFYPNFDTENIDIETEEGEEIANKFGIDALPAYIFNSSFKETHNYDKFSSSFNQVDGSFVMKNTMANANYYLEREEIANKLDLFLISDQDASLQAEENLKEFLEVFDDEVNLTKHNENSEIVKELGINTFPTFLINNKVKFGGVQAADTIRENFCQINSVTECALGLSKSLV